MRLTILSAFLFLFLQLPLHAQVLDGIAAIVGEDIILYSDIENQVQYLISDGQHDDGSMHCSVLENLLISKLLLNKAKQDSLTVNDDQVDSETDRRIKSIQDRVGGQKELEKIYGKTVIQIRDDIRDEIKEQLLMEQMRSKVMSGVKATPKEVKDFFKGIPQDSLPFLPAEVEIFQIVIKPPFSEASIEAAKSKLEGIREEVMQGKDFGTMARAFSMDPGSARDGGNLGEFGRGMMVAEFEEVVFNMKEGEISMPFLSPFGMHIIKLQRRLGDKVQASHILIVPEKTGEDDKLALEKLEKIRGLILRDSLTFQEAAIVYSQDPSSKDCGGCVRNPQSGEQRIPLDLLDADLYLTVDGMKEGEISSPNKYIDPQLMDAYFRLVYLKKRIPPHIANLKDDYQKLYNATVQTKQAEALEKWFLSARKNIYIEIKDKSCQSALKHWN